MPAQNGKWSKYCEIPELDTADSKVACSKIVRPPDSKCWQLFKCKLV